MDIKHGFYTEGEYKMPTIEIEGELIDPIRSRDLIIKGLQSEIEEIKKIHKNEIKKLQDEIEAREATIYQKDRLSKLVYSDIFQSSKIVIKVPDPLGKLTKRIKKNRKEVELSPQAIENKLIHNIGVAIDTYYEPSKDTPFIYLRHIKEVVKRFFRKKHCGDLKKGSNKLILQILKEKGYGYRQRRIGQIITEITIKSCYIIQHIDGYESQDEFSMY